MKVLWLCNIMLPVVAESLGLTCSNKEGWLAGLSKKIISEKDTQDLELGVCFPVSAGQNGLCGKTEGLSFFGFYEDTVHPEIYQDELEKELKKIVEIFQPDVVHIFGTEYPHALAMVRAWNRPERTLAGIQGLMFAYAKCYMADLPMNIQNRKTFRDWLKKDDLKIQQEKFKIRGEAEKEALGKVLHVTGRTDWDRELTGLAAPQAKYHFMNETLRGQFYGPVWEYEKCRPHSIFLSQGNYPIKGLHYLLEALPEIMKRFPDTHVYVAGDKITAYQTLKDKIKIGNYGKYILELLHENGLEQSVTFLGRLNAEEMLKQYLESNLFVSPSAIENSPNSVGEAMLLGMPVVSSDVGGVHNMLVSGKEGLLYPADRVELLAEAVLHVFSEQAEAVKMGKAAKEHAEKTHNPQKNFERLMEIYHEINLCV